MTLAIIGHGRSGKDYAAQYLSNHTPLNYIGSVSWAMLPYVAKRLGVCEMTAWENRHRDRVMWMDHINEYRSGDPALAIRNLIEAGADIIPGVRMRKEFEAAQEEGLLDLVVWVERDVPHDPTCELSEEDADIVISNRGTLKDFDRELDKLIRALTVKEGTTWHEEKEEGMEAVLC